MPVDPLLPYVPRLLALWPEDRPAPAALEVDGSLAFVDISGFTAMSERLARAGRIGAEEVSGVINGCFSSLLGAAYAEDGSLLKFGGDALLLLFTGAEHEVRAARAAARMRRILREIGRLQTSAGNAVLRMSVGIHAGRLNLFLVGESHHELLVCGPAASRTVEMESAAAAGQILLSPELAAALPPAALGRARPPGVLLGRTPPGASAPFSMLSASPGPVADAVPVAVREHLLAGGDEPEHRLVTVGFVHVGGIDERLAAAGSQSVLDELHDLVRAVQVAASTHGITFLGSDIASDGVKIILVAGAPVARDDDEGRLLRAARSVVAHPSPFHVRIGVSRGPVFAGDIGPPYRRTYTVMGDTVNLAARLMQGADAGEVLASPDAVERSRAGFDTQEVEPFRVKGKAAPVRALRVGALASGRGRGSAGEGTAFVGREAELGVLLAGLADLRSGRGRVVEIVGEPGIGKSRLVEELIAQARGVAVLRAACDPYETSTPYHPFRALLRELAGIPDAASDAAAAERLQMIVDRSVPWLAPWLPLLAAPLGLELPRTPETANLEDRFRRERLHAALLELIAALAPGPVLLLVEDSHWIDDASAELLAALDGNERRPWLLVTTRRDVATPLRLEGERTTTLALEPLAAAASEALVAAATNARPLLQHEADALIARAGGNPLFLRELVSSARSAGALPDSIEAAIAVRIDRLSPRDRAVLRRLSVLGTTIDRAVADAVLPADCGPDPSAGLGDFLERLDDSTLRFRHALIRDTAYAGLPYRLRQELHASVAERIEREAFPAVDAHAEVLALHFSEAGREGSAWVYCRMAARRSRAMYANVEAARFYERALRAARGLETVTSQAEAELWEELGDVRNRMGEFDKATLALRAARRLRQGDPVARAQLLLKEAWVARRAGRFADALRWITKGRLSLDGTTGDQASRERARLSAWYASIRQEQGRSAEAIRWARRAIDEAEASGARDVLAHASYILDWAYVLEGRLDLATHSERALAIYEELGDLAGQANVLNNLGGFAYERGRWEEAMRYYERGREARAKTGDAVNSAFGTINVAEILADQGRLDEAEERIRDALRVWVASGYRSGTAYAQMLLGRVMGRDGRHEEALEHLQQAREEFAYVGAAGDLIAVDAREAEVRLLKGEHEAAGRLAADALARAASLKAAKVYEPLMHRTAGYARLFAGDLTAARAAFAASLAEARARQADYEVALTLRALADLAELGADAEAALALRTEAAPILERAGVVSVPEVPLPEFR